MPRILRNENSPPRQGIPRNTNPHSRAESFHIVGTKRSNEPIAHLAELFKSYFKSHGSAMVSVVVIVYLLPPRNDDEASP